MDDQTRLNQQAHLDEVRYDTATGLVPVVVQDVDTGQVLMQAYANREALKRTLGTGHAWFWSRSRQDYWQKGATSGNVQAVVDVRLDCDGDSVLYLVQPAGPACHTGETTCFYRSLTYPQGERRAPSAESDAAASVQDTRATVGASDLKLDKTSSEPSTVPEFLTSLWRIVDSRYRDRPQGSYTTYLFEQGVDKVAKKVGEEATEVVIAAKNAVLTGEARSEVASESADLLFHLLALWKVSGINPSDVWRVLAERHRS